MVTEGEMGIFKKKSQIHRGSLAHGDAGCLLAMFALGLSQVQKSRTDRGKAIIQSIIKTSESKISNLQSDLEKRKRIRETYKTRERALKQWEKELNERYFYIKNREHVIDILNKKLELLENELRDKEEEISGLEQDLRERQEEIEVNKKILYELQKIIMEKQQEIDNAILHNTVLEADQDTKRILWILDELLGNLPRDLIEKFAESDDYALYEEVLRKYNV